MRSKSTISTDVKLEAEDLFLQLSSQRSWRRKTQTMGKHDGRLGKRSALEDREQPVSGVCGVGNRFLLRSTKRTHGQVWETATDTWEREVPEKLVLSAGCFNVLQLSYKTFFR